MSAVPSQPEFPGSPVQPGEVIAEKYVVESVVAKGGMGIVLAARHQQLGQQVAIKVLLPSELLQEPNAVARFIREARAAAGLQSEHVVRIFDVGTLPDGLPFMVMELMRGKDLRTVVRKNGPLSVEDVAFYVLQACDAVGEAHENGIVHRDLKPSNLFLAQRRDGSSIVKVLDFGISKAPVGLPGGTLELTTSSVMMGSPLYMSPEQIRDARSVDHRTDIWALGVILYQLLTAKPPFNGDSLPAVCAAIAADTPTPITRTDVPLPFCDVIWKCLAKRPADRFQSVAELAAQLRPFAGQRQVTAVAAGAPPHIAEAQSTSGLAFPSPDSFTPGTPYGNGGVVVPAREFQGAADAETISYNRLLSNKDALRAAPVGVGLETDAPLASTLVHRLGGRRASAILGLLALILAVLLVLTIGKLVSSPNPSAEDSGTSPVSPIAPAAASPKATLAEPTATGVTTAVPVTPQPSAAATAPVALPAPPKAKPVQKAKPAAVAPPPKPTSDIRKTR